MHAFGIISVLALVGSTIAAPVPEPELVVVVETEIATVIVTAGAEPTVKAVEVQSTSAPESYRGHRGRPHGSGRPFPGSGRPFPGTGRPSGTAPVPVSTVIATIRPSTSAAAAPTKPTTTAAPTYTPIPTSAVPTYTPVPTTAAPTYTPIPTSAVPTYTPVPTTAKPTTVKPTTSAAAPSSTAPATGGSDYMSIVNKWRGKLSLSTLTQDSTLEANAMKTCVDGNGKMVHELNPGTMGQVLAPGSADEFEKVFVGGWLCEVPSTPGLDGICATMSSGWDYAGQTGHNEILTSKSYSKIGCALAGGIWGCDFA